MPTAASNDTLWWLIVTVAAILIIPSIRVIGPTQVGLVIKRFGFKSLGKDNPIAFEGEAGYQADLLMPGWRWKFWIVYKVEKYPWVEVPAGEIGVVVAQVGEPLPIGAKSAVYRDVFGNFTNLRVFVANKGQKGVQRPVLPPGSLLPIHPVGFLVITKRKVYGVPIIPELQGIDNLSCTHFGLRPEQLELVRIQPMPHGGREEIIDMIGIVTTFEGEPLPSGAIAGRLGGFADIEETEQNPEIQDAALIEVLLGTKNEMHNNYQDFQAFLDNGGKIGLQHDPLLYGAFALNPFLVSVELVPMLVVEQGQVAVIGQDGGFAEEPGAEGHAEPLRTGKYAINPRCYQAEIVPTAILTLNWAEATSSAHSLDARLQAIEAKSREGFVFKFDLQVQIHVPDTKAPKVISSVGTMQNLVDEVLQAAVGNYFRNKLQSMPAITFIETRAQVQKEAFDLISRQLMEYQVETKGVYIQDVVLPEGLVAVLTQREIANQEVETFQKQKAAQIQRIDMEQAKGTADMQAQLAQAKVNVDIAKNQADARKAIADGEATYIRETGKAQGAQVEAVGLARAKAFEEQVKALGQEPTALINAIAALSEHGVKIMPDILVAGGSGVEGLAATLMNWLQSGGKGGDRPRRQLPQAKPSEKTSGAGPKTLEAPKAPEVSNVESPSQ